MVRHGKDADGEVMILFSDDYAVMVVKVSELVVGLFLVTQKLNEFSSFVLERFFV